MDPMLILGIAITAVLVWWRERTQQWPFDRHYMECDDCHRTDGTHDLSVEH